MEAEVKWGKLIVCKDLFTSMSIHNLTISPVNLLHFPAERCA